MRAPAASPASVRTDFAAWEPAVMLGWLFVAGATIGQLSIFLPRAPHTNVGALEVNIALAYLGAAAVFLVFRRMPLWTFHPVMLAGTALITRAVYYSGQGVSYYGIWYLWVALFAFSFFRRREATLHVAVAGLAYAGVLAARHEPIAVGRWLTTMASLLIAGVFIDALVRRVRRQRQQAADNAANLSSVVDAMHRIFQEPTADATRVDLCATTLGEHPAGAALAFRTGQPSFACVTDHHIELDSAKAGAVSRALWQPVLRDQVTVGVLAFYWRSTVPAPEQNVRATIALLGAQAAVAIERVELLARLERIAQTDELTGLGNRRAWREQLPLEMARARREQRSLCVAMLDIDGLKELNDTHGHHAGDQLLKQNAAAWSSVLRPDDLLVRYGGDEFAAAFSGCGLAQAHKLIARLIQATPENHSFSVGIAEWDGAQDVHALMAEADARLYEAKGLGGKFATAS